MKIRVQTTEKLTNNEIKRLGSSLSDDFENEPLQCFNVVPASNCCTLKLTPVSNKESLSVQHVLTVASVHLFALAVEEDHRGWCFLLPQHGNVFTTISGLIFVRPDIERLKKSFTKRIRIIDGDVKALDPEVYLPHSDFSICGLDNGAVLFVARNTTHVVTQ
jgi:hypothetical protein